MGLLLVPALLFPEEKKPGDPVPAKEDPVRFREEEVEQVQMIQGGKYALLKKELEAVLIRVDTGNVLLRIRPVPVLSAPSPDGGFLAIGSSSGRIHILQSDSNQKFETDILAPISFQFAREGLLVAATHENLLIGYDPVEKKRIFQKTIPGLTAMALYPDGGLVFTANTRGELAIFDTRNGAILHEIRIHDHAVRFLAFTDGFQLISLDDPGEILIQDYSPESLMNRGSAELRERAKQYVKRADLLQTRMKKKSGSP